MIYLDNAATTIIKPQRVTEAVLKAMTSLGNAGRGVNDASLDASRMIYETRVKLSAFFGSDDPSGCVFTSNATEALNTAIKGILSPKDHVITTPMEHNSVLRPLYELEDKGLSVSFAKADEKGVIDPDSIENLIRPDTKAIICTHASNLTGNVTDIISIGKIAKKNNIIFIVDASQTAGAIPINVGEMNIDVLCFTGHKSLLGPQGTGGMIVNKNVNISPLKSGGTGVATYSRTQPPEMPTHLEAGTLNGHGIAGLSAAMDYVNEMGLENLYNREMELADYFYREVSHISNVIVYGDFSGTKRCPIISLNIGDYDSAQAGDILFNDYEISIRSGAHCAPLAHKTLGTVEKGAVRFSFSHFNTQKEVEYAINSVKEMSNG